MTDIPAEGVNELVELALDRIAQPPPVPDHVRQARANNTETPSGVHTCQALAGAAWFTTGDHWFCPFCGEQGPGYATEAAS